MGDPWTSKELPKEISEELRSRYISGADDLMANVEALDEGIAKLLDWETSQQVEYVELRDLYNYPDVEVVQDENMP